MGVAIGILGGMVGAVFLFLWLVNLDAKRTLQATRRDRVPLWEVLLARIPPGADGPPVFRGAISIAQGSASEVTGLLIRALAELELDLPARLDPDGPIVVEPERAAEAAEVLRRALGPRRGAFARALAELEVRAPEQVIGAGAEAIEQALELGGSDDDRTPALDVVHLIVPLQELCQEAARKGEGVMLLPRYAAVREALRNLQGEPSDEPQPERWCLELQLFPSRLPVGEETSPPDSEALRRAYLATSASLPLPSGRQVLYLVLVALGRLSGRDLPVHSLDEGEALFGVAAGDVPELIDLLEAARDRQRDAFVAALVELEEEDAQVNPDPCAGEERIREVLDAGELVGEPTPSLEAASVVDPLLRLAREARSRGDGLQLLYRGCPLPSR